MRKLLLVLAATLSLSSCYTSNLGSYNLAREDVFSTLRIDQGVRVVTIDDKPVDWAKGFGNYGYAYIRIPPGPHTFSAHYGNLRIHSNSPIAFASQFAAGKEYTVTPEIDFDHGTITLIIGEATPLLRPAARP